MKAPRHVIILGMGLMGCDIAAIFLKGGWRVSAVETARDRWPAAQARVAQSITQLDGGPALAAGLTLFDDMKAPDYASAEAGESIRRGFVEPMMVRPVIAIEQLLATLRRERAQRPPVAGLHIRRAHAESGTSLQAIIGEALDIDHQARHFCPHNLIGGHPFGVEGRRMPVGQPELFQAKVGV